MKKGLANATAPMMISGDGETGATNATVCCEEARVDLRRGLEGQT